MGESETTLDLEEARRKIQEEKPVRRRELLESFAGQEGEDIDRLIMSFMEDPSADVRRTVVGIMRRRGFQDREFYSRAAGDPSAVVQRTATAALKSLERLQLRQRTLSDQLFRRVATASDRPREESYYARLIQSSEKTTRFDAIKRLADLKESWATELLFRAVRDESWTNRSAAVEALAKREEVPVDRLLEGLNDRIWYVRSTTLEILGLRRDASHVTRMAHLARDSNVEVRLALANALGSIGGEDSARVLDTLVRDPNYGVRQAAEKALKGVRKQGASR